ncbi:MAG TPA: mechanosensitive ion channel domain-containing protein [Clostridia bacterium]|nr:mechanosensitive ion channel domain-containing protein [Clostridia bacterium]
MAKSRQNFVLSILVLLAAVVSVGIWFSATPEEAANPSQRRRSGTPRRVVDQQVLQSAQQLEKLATSREELRFERDAIRLADHEVDLAFASALRDARQHPPAETPETTALHARLREFEVRIRNDQELVAKLVSAIAVSKSSKLESLQDDLHLAQAELVLHERELENTKFDLLRAGGDPETRIQRLFKQHEAAQHNDQGQTLISLGKAEPFQIPRNVAAQVRLWQELREKRQRLREAQGQVTNASTLLVSKQGELEKHIQQLSTTTAQPAMGAVAVSQKVAAASALEHLAEDRKTLTEYDERIQDQQQLAQIYGDWASLIRVRMRACLHALLQCLLAILFIVAFVVAGNGVVGKLSARIAVDRRRLATMRLLGRFVVQATGVLLVLLIVLGSPSQLSTIIAFAGAGLTVALKDFIVAFFGWFILMGKHGIRVGDWVEINGISGEVVEIGLLRTVLLETGNWADSGYPTGRRVTFVNSFAIEGHYFNFSTTGQWLWDNLEVLIPDGQDPHTVTDAILQLAIQQTEASAKIAEHEWKRAGKEYGKQSFSAAPAVNVRPTTQGINLNVRYITRAHERHETRARLYQSIVDLLHKRSSATDSLVAQSDGKQID